MPVRQHASARVGVGVVSWGMSSSPFADLDRMMDLPRLGGLLLSPDGSRLVTGVAVLDGDADAPRARRATAAWEVDPTGERPARRLTLARTGDEPAGFTADGDLLIRSARDLPAGVGGTGGRAPGAAAPDAPAAAVSAREAAQESADEVPPVDAPDESPAPDTPDPARPGEADAPAVVPDTAALWLLPRGGGELQPLATHPGGLRAAHVARSGALLVEAATLAGSASPADDARRRAARKATRVTAVLHDGGPVRHWDADLPAEVHRLYRVEPSATEEAAGGAGSGADALAAPALARLVDVDPNAGDGTVGTPSRSVSVDDAGEVAVIVEGRRAAGGAWLSRLVRVDLADGARRVLVEGTTEANPGTAAVSPDGATVAVVMGADPDGGRAPSPWLELVDAATGERRRLAEGWDRWAQGPTWLPDGSGLLVTADDHAHGPLFRIAVGEGSGAGAAEGAGADAEGTVRRLTGNGALHDVVVAPDGSAAYALRASWAHPEEIVRVDLGAAGVVVHAPDAAAVDADARAGDETRTGLGAEVRERLDSAVTALRGPAPRPELPGTLTEFWSDGADGTPVHSWLALPAGASEQRPAPLLLWVHGGPLNSWNAWSWRWIPWLFVAQGYAVLLPDPGLSTGYGRSMVDRGWGEWGTTVFEDLMRATDAAVARADIDGERTAAMGGSFGGYMANWIAGHTDRFDAIVSHAGLWALDQFASTTDHPQYWNCVLPPEVAREHSPHRSVERIGTPMLVIHGDKDYRVPVGEGLRLFTDLLTRSALPQGGDGRTAHRLLVFPVENHWILKPQNHKVWNQVVLRFLEAHVLGERDGEAPRRLPLEA